ncbi:MAG: alpha/beta hydrolase [Chloroflexota bacterium]|nr:alpha/beta hydrolase [Chloroflexota bacterium]MDE2856445.1 alpha/beta hydrolase [Chloroflexota bacterium]MDE2951762.1 alpha/beta hydrolase [Chloroflexota bacterium]
MDFLASLDPEVVPGLEALPAEMISSIGDNPPLAREMLAGMLKMMEEMLPPSDVSVTERTIPGPDIDVPVAIYQPPAPPPRPGLLWIHGGGYVVGTAREDINCNAFAEHVGCTIVSVDYRMAPEATYKEAVSDCFAALQWMVEHADELGIDASRVAIGGASAGSGLSAGLALYNRDHNGPDLAFQLLIYPMIDDRHDTPSGQEITYEKVWNRDVSLKAWQMYLGDEYGSDAVSPYAAAVRAQDLSGLPPAFITVGTRDLFRDEAIDYAQRLMAAGVPTELQVYPGMYHGGEVMSPMAAVSQRMRQGYLEALKRALSA